MSDEKSVFHKVHVRFNARESGRQGIVKWILMFVIIVRMSNWFCLTCLCKGFGGNQHRDNADSNHNGPGGGE